MTDKETDGVCVDIQSIEPPDIKSPRRYPRSCHGRTNSDLLQQDVESRIRIPAPEIRAEPLTACECAPSQRHVLARCRIICISEIVESFLDSLLMEPWVHFTAGLLCADKILNK